MPPFTAISSAEVSRRLAVATLVIIVMALPITRAAVQFLLPEGGSTVVARIHVTFFELLFIAAVLGVRQIQVPPLKALPPVAFWLLTFWFVWAGTAVLKSPLPIISLVRQTEWIVHGLFALTLWAFLRTYPDWRTVVPRFLVLGFLTYGLVILFLLLKVPDDLDFPWTASLFGFRNVRHFGAYASAALVAAHLPLLRRDAGASNEVRRTFILLSVIWAFIMWSGGRGSILAIFASLGFLTVLGLLPAPRRLWRVTVLAAVLGAFISVPFTPPHRSFGAFRFLYTAEGSESVKEYSSGRIDQWRGALPLITANPWFGIGPDQYSMRSDTGYGWLYEHTHNSLLQAALAWGIPGAVFFLAGLILALRRSLGAARNGADPPHLVGLWMALMLLVHSLVSGTLYYAWSLMGLALAFALMVPGRAAHAETRRFDVDVHGLTVLASLIMLLAGAATWALVSPGAPAKDDMRPRLITGFSAPMAIEAAGERLDRWAMNWREEDPDAAYAWAQWTAEHSRSPWTSRHLIGQWMIDDGYLEEGKRILKEATDQRPDNWKPLLEDEKRTAVELHE